MTSQLQAICKILETGDFSFVIMNNLTEEHFFNYRAEFNFIKNHYNQYKVVPDKVTFLNTFPDFDYISVREPENFLVEQLVKDYQTSVIIQKFNTIKKQVEAGNTPDAITSIIKAAEELSKSSTTMTCVDLLKDKSRFDKYVERTYNKEKYYIPTGFKDLDKIIGGIDIENEFMVIAARTGRGKTMTLVKLAAEAARQGKTVGIYEGEMTEDKLGYRIDTMLSHINNNSITRGDLYVKEAYKNYMDTLDTKGYGAIKVITPNSINGPATVSALEAFINKEKLDILFVDQFSLLEDTSHAKAMHERVGNIAKDLKKLQVKSLIPVVAVAQMNRTKNEDGEQDTTQIGLSDMIPQYATVLLMLDRKDDQFIINIVKSRDGGDDKKLYYHADFNTGRFDYIPSEQSGDMTQEQAQALQDEYAPVAEELPFSPQMQMPQAGENIFN